MTETIRMVGQVDAIYFENPTNFYKVIRILVDLDQSEFTLASEYVVTGQFAVLHMDTDYEFFGTIVNHPKYGEQLNVSRYQQLSPTSEMGLIEYLSSQRFKGIGMTLAERIVEHLGVDAIETIIQSPECLKEIPGLTKKVADGLIQTLMENQGTERIFIQLTEWGFGPKLSEKIYQKFQSQTIDLIKENPYCLIENIEGISFSKADSLAEQLGIDSLSPYRLMAGIYTVIYQVCMNEGDTYVDQSTALLKARDLLEQSRSVLISEQPLQEALDQALAEQKIVQLDQKLMLNTLFYAEANIARRFQELLKYDDVEKYQEEEIEQQMKQLIKETGMTYDQIQVNAIETAIKSPISIITGGPGTGKTTLIKAIIGLHAKLNDIDLKKASRTFEEAGILLAAPTGRAAKRMSDTTGLKASTIHRLIGFNRETTIEDLELNELEGSLIIIDEMSMVDTWLMNWLLKAIPYHMQIIFVGDRDQLPSVGPGQVFADIIDSGKIPTITLQKIYRQATESSIIHLAHHIRNGGLPQNFMEKQADRSFIPAQTNQISSVLHKIVTYALDKGFDANTMQVLAPMYKGPAGINALNEMLQSLLNPPKAKKREVEYFETIFRVGDKVIQLVNNADVGIYNGDIGTIEAIFTEKETESKKLEILVCFDDDREQVYYRSDLDQLKLAYCTSIHKAQGSEYDLVILPLVDLHSRLLRKDILYTAVTRAQSSLVMVGNPQSFVKAVSQKNLQRHTNLIQFMNDYLQDSQVSHVNKEMQESQPIESKISDSTASYILTMDNYLTIDPMIGMEALSPQDFLS